MGYRSYVKSMVYGTEEALITYLTEEKLKENNIFTHFKGKLKRMVIPMSKDRIIHAITLECIDSKWYPNYIDVKAWDDFMHESLQRGLSMEFCRVGEEMSDIESLQYGDENEYFLQVISTIELDVPEETIESGV
jgi:hypothetical protein